MFVTLSLLYNLLIRNSLRTRETVAMVRIQIWIYIKLQKY